jgi:hypothetical protein
LFHATAVPVKTGGFAVVAMPAADCPPPTALAASGVREWRLNKSPWRTSMCCEMQAINPGAK